MPRIRIKCVIFVIAVAALVCHASPAIPDNIPGYSGMAQVSHNAFLTVNDRKNKIESGYRLGVIALTAEDGIVFTPISVREWNKDKYPSDLEACCAIPDRDGEFLIAESGFYKDNYGRIFHVTLSKDNEDFWVVTVNKEFKIYNRKLDAKNSSYKGDQVEGISCFNALGKTILVYGERGGPTHGGKKKVGTIVWGTIDFGTYQFGKLGEAPLVNKSVLGDRDCSALRLIPNEDGNVSVLSVATRDADDNGPFHSVVYLAGRFMVDQKEKTIQFTRDTKPQILSELSGIKVEALAGPAKNAPESKYSIATDDEHFGGIWRPLFGE